MKKRIFQYVFLLVLTSISHQVYAQLGVVLMHGKQGTASSKSPIGHLESFLIDNDILVKAPDMPWHRNRYLEKSYEDSMKEIDEAVEWLRSRGATKIVVGGHSMGANAAMGYGARRDELAGIMAIAAGHVPDNAGYQSKINNDWERAKEMVDTGKGHESEDFQDRNQGKNNEFSTTAEIYLSWFQPKGPASMSTNVSNLRENTPLLWIIGEKDRMHTRRGKEYAFNNAPEHANNAYVVVKGGHKATPRKGKQKILEWLNGLD